MLQFAAVSPPARRRYSVEPFMAPPTPNRSRGHLPTFLPSGRKIRWRLGNSSTKVPFRHQHSPSTLVTARGSASLVIFYPGGQLSLRARNPLVRDRRRDDMTTTAQQLTQGSL